LDIGGGKTWVGGGEILADGDGGHKNDDQEHFHDKWASFGGRGLNMSGDGGCTVRWNFCHLGEEMVIYDKNN